MRPRENSFLSIEHPLNTSTLKVPQYENADEGDDPSMADDPWERRKKSSMLGSLPFEMFGESALERVGEIYLELCETCN
jgi:hypothetical protein